MRTEANLTAVIVALTDRLSRRNPLCPVHDAALCTDETGQPVPYEYWRHGCVPLRVRPTLYVSPQTHVSIEKNARNLIGAASIRTVPVGGDLRMDVEALDNAMAADAKSGTFFPFLVVGSIGATPSGIVDPLDEIGEVCRRHGAWFHVDAPWGGSPHFRRASEKRTFPVWMPRTRSFSTRTRPSCRSARAEPACFSAGTATRRAGIQCLGRRRGTA